MSMTLLARVERKQNIFWMEKHINILKSFIIIIMTSKFYVLLCVTLACVIAELISVRGSQEIAANRTIATK